MKHIYIAIAILFTGMVSAQSFDFECGCTTLFSEQGTGVQHGDGYSTSFSGLDDSVVIVFNGDGFDHTKVKNGSDFVETFNALSGEAIDRRTIIKINRPASWADVYVDYSGETLNTTDGPGYSNGFGVRILRCN